MTSIPASRFSSIRRSSSANMYGGIAPRRSEGAVNPFFFAGAAIGLGRLRGLELRQRAQELRGELPRIQRLRPAREPHREALADLHAELAPIEQYRELACGALEMRRHGCPARPGPGRKRLPHPSLEDPRSDAVAVDAEEADV